MSTRRRAAAWSAATLLGLAALLTVLVVRADDLPWWTYVVLGFTLTAAGNAGWRLERARSERAG